MQKIINEIEKTLHILFDLLSKKIFSNIMNAPACALCSFQIY